MVKDAAQNDSYCQFELFDKLDLGALIFDYPRREVIFANREENNFYDKLSSGYPVHFVCARRLLILYYIKY
ncbi:MAG: hypothetical protein GY950_30155 [bacterium]|nr:hypothetical protein [bacterium]